MPSELPEASNLPSSENAMAPTKLRCLSSVCRFFPVWVSQSRMTESGFSFGLYHLPVANILPSAERTGEVQRFPNDPIGTSRPRASFVPAKIFQAQTL